jgi:uncharacterized protein (DUF58 family)
MQSKVYDKNVFKNLSYRCYFKQSEVTQGDDIVFVEEVTNGKYLPIPWLKAELTTSRYLNFSENCSSVTHESRFVSSSYAMQGNKSVRREWKLTSSKRGVYSIDGVVLNACDILGMGEYSTPVNGVDANIMVLPQIVSTPEIDLEINGIVGDFEVKRNLLTDVFSMRGTKPYTGYERLNRIHWKSSAKVDNLMVVDEDYSSDVHVRVFMYLPNGCENTLAEKVLSMACSVAVKLSQKGIPVMLDTNVGRRTAVSFGESHAMEIRRFSAELTLSPVGFEIPQLERDTVLVVVTTLANKALEYPQGTKTIFVRL